MYKSVKAFLGNFINYPSRSSYVRLYLHHEKKSVTCTKFISLKSDSMKFHKIVSVIFIDTSIVLKKKVNFTEMSLKFAEKIKRIYCIY